MAFAHLLIWSFSPGAFCLKKTKIMLPADGAVVAYIIIGVATDGNQM